MARLDFDSFCMAMAALAEYYGKELSEGVMMIYFNGLSHLSSAEFNKAIKTVTSQRKYASLPKVAEILEALNGDPNERAELALKELLDALKLHGTNKSICFKDRAIMGVIDAVGGWVELGKLSGKEWEAFKTFEFKKRYVHWANNVDKCPLWLAGDSYQKNKFNNQPLDNEIIGLVGFSDSEITWWKRDMKLEISARGVRARIVEFEPVIAMIAQKIDSKKTASQKMITDVTQAKRISA